MDTFSLILDAVLGLPEVERWPQMADLVRRKAARQPKTWLLPIVGCEAAGGAPEQALPAAAAVACLQTSIILIDDLLDDDARGEFQRLGAPGAANLASAFQAAGLDVVARCGAGAEARLAALAGLNRMMIATALGQHLDVQNPDDEEAYWRLVRAKSSPFYGAALLAGAALGGATLALADKLDHFGRLYGELVQIHDDLNDSLAVPVNPDWLLGRLPLPILYARTVDHPERGRFEELRQSASNPEALLAAQGILVRSGAVSYCIDQLLRRYQSARQALAEMRLTHCAGLDSLLDEVARPVWELFRTMGLPHPVSPDLAAPG